MSVRLVQFRKVVLPIRVTEEGMNTAFRSAHPSKRKGRLVTLPGRENSVNPHPWKAKSLNQLKLSGSGRDVNALQPENPDSSMDRSTGMSAVARFAAL